MHRGHLRSWELWHQLGRCMMQQHAHADAQKSGQSLVDEREGADASSVFGAHGQPGWLKGRPTSRSCDVAAVVRTSQQVVVDRCRWCPAPWVQCKDGADSIWGRQLSQGLPTARPQVHVQLSLAAPALERARPTAHSFLSAGSIDSSTCAAAAPHTGRADRPDAIAHLDITQMIGQ